MVITRRKVALVALAGMIAGGGAVVGIGAATAQTHQVASATGGGYRMLATPYKLFTNHSFAANAVYSVVGIGGATTVPTNATSILIRVTAKGALGGYLTVTPAGLPADGYGQTLNWVIGGSAFDDFALGVGTKSQITFSNGNHAATASATITGYSTRVSPSDVDGEGGLDGQVLTDTVYGPTWRNAGGPGYSVNGTTYVDLRPTDKTIATLDVAPGTFFVMFSTNVFTNGASSDANNVDCYMNSGSTTFAVWHEFMGPNESTTAIMQGMVVSAGDPITVQCHDTDSNATTGRYPVLSAVGLSGAVGDNVH